MNKDFVPFELAKKLKEKGFREKVNAYYGKHENLFDVHPALDMNDCDYRASAPTISQVLKWLREEKKVYIMIDLTHFRSKVKWFFNCRKTVVDLFDTAQTTSSLHNSYEEASIAGIEYVLDNLI